MRRSARAPGAIAVDALFYSLIILVFSGLWRSATAAKGGALGDYDFASLLWYTMAAEAAVTASRQRMIESTGEDIGDGTVISEMLRPVSVVGMRMASELGDAILRLSANVCTGVPVVCLIAGAPSVSPLMLAVPALVLAVAANIAAQHVFAGLAFWLNDAKGAWFLYQKLVFLPGGMLLPLQLLPVGMERMCKLLPFWTMAYAPARLMSGHFEPQLLIGQALWLVVLAGAAIGVFGLGERRVQVSGG